MNEVITTKMEGPGQVTIKDLKKVAASKKLAEYNRRKREELAQVTKAQIEPKLTSKKYYGIGAVIAAVGVLSVLGYVLPIQERRHHQGDSGSIFGTSNL